ncbi:hypothetical protein Ade02nite_16160 [Paractinoplanes deccanensis]|uniref:histidine kinase n=1 Tax=Paractinoplanes deccanensis TaxID=113561 RepID=A0ABQ3XZC5_9ACTN|nr:hypothetical protein Ade02nite_16160 [Actinoplanes deccanensis]
MLVAEDEVDHQRAMTEVIQGLGHQAAVAEDGWAALVAATHHRPDLVVADVDMRDMDGLQLCRALHEDPALTGIPVVLVSGLVRPGDPRLSASGAVATVGKPCDAEELAATLAYHLGGGPARAAPMELPPVIPQFLEAMVHSVDVGMAACDTAGRLTVFNDFLRDFFGDASAAVPIKEWTDRFGLRHHDGSPLQTDELPMIRALRGETVVQAGLLAADQRGRQRWLRINARPVYAGETVIGAVAAVHDITVEYRSRVYRACKSEVLRALAESPDSVAATDAVVRIVGSTLGWPYVRLWLVDPVTDRLRPAAHYTAPGRPELPMPTSLGRGQSLAGVCWERGDMVWVPDIHAPDSPVLPEIAAAANYRAGGAIPVRSGDRIAGVMTYFTYEQHEPEPSLVLLLAGVVDSVGAYREQRRADDLARNLAATTDEYIALVGHELRTPLTSITSYAELLAESPELTADLRDLVEVVCRNGRRLHELVGQLLDLAALDAGHSVLTVAELDLGDVVDTAVGQVVAAAEARDITVETRTSGSLALAGDAGRLTQMLHGLLDNALKFSQDGAIVTVTATGDDGTVTLTVTDTGAGLPAGELPHLFRRLYRGDNARHRGVPGNGLGLALSRAIVEHHQGTITLGAHRPRGTAVTVRLPRRMHTASP